jgi:hypothetical protein
MLQMRARAFVLRDAFADVLKGLSIREEVEDYQTPRDVTPKPPIPAPVSRPTLVPPKPAPVAETIEHDAETGEVMDTAQAPPDGAPDPSKDPDAFVKWAAEQIRAFDDFEAANTWFNDVVEPAGIFPPDKEELVGELRRLEERLAP